MLKVRYGGFIVLLTILFVFGTANLMVGAEFDSEAMTKSHFAAIAAEDGLLALEGAPAAPDSYTKDAYLSWAGGPLDGRYSGRAIGEVWSKFFTANEVKDYTIVEGSEKYMPRFATAGVVFTLVKNGSESKLPVTFVISFSAEGKIELEKWTVDQTLIEEEDSEG